MKRLILIKLCDTFQLAHLYEHLFYACIDTLFRDNGYYQPIDYLISADTYSNGVIVIDIEVYNNSITDEFLRSLKESRLDIADEYIEIGLNQLVAEKQVEFNWVEYGELRRMLYETDKMAWYDADEVTVRDLADRTVKERGVIETKEKIQKKNALKFELRLQINDRMLVPLYRQIAGSIMNTLALDVADTYAYFITSRLFAMNNRGTVIATFNTGYAEVMQEEIQKLYAESVAQMRQDGAFDRLLAVLAHMSYLKPTSHVRCHPGDTFEDTDILIGSKGWKNISTEDNLQKILDNLELKIRYNGDSPVSPHS